MDTDIDKRVPQPSIKSLESKLQLIESDLNVIVSSKLSVYENNSDTLSRMASTCKARYKDFCEIIGSLVDLKIKNGSLTDADELRQSKLDMKNDVRQFINLSNSYLQRFELNISFNTTSSIGDGEFSENTLRCREFDLDTMRSSTPCPNNQAESKIYYPSDIVGAVGGAIPAAVSSTLPTSASFAPVADNFLLSVAANTGNIPVRLPAPEADEALINPNVVSAPLTGSTSYTVGRGTTGSVTFNDQVIYSNASSLPRSCYSTVGSKPLLSEFSASARKNPELTGERPLHFPSYTTSTSVPYLQNFPDASSARENPQQQHFVGERQNFPRNIAVSSRNLNKPSFTPVTTEHFLESRDAGKWRANVLSRPRQVSANHHTTIPVAAPHYGPPPNHQTFGLYNPPQPCSKQASSSDMLANHIVKNQLFQRIGEPFNGEPLKYHSWMKVLERKMSGLSLDSWDILTVLYENCIGPPKRMVEDFMSTGAINPDVTLDDAMHALHSQFGTGTRIADAIMKRLDSFAPIKSPHHSQRLAELITLCKLISVNAPEAAELEIFNTPYGVKNIWQKLPEQFQNSWRKYANDFKRINFGSPNLGNLISFLEDKFEEFSDPCYAKSVVAPDSTRPPKKTTLKTNANQDSTSNSKYTYDCFIHPNGKHCLEQCNVFRQKTFEDKRKTIIEHKRCFRCLGPHFKDKCSIKISCCICKGTHATSMHRDPDKVKPISQPQEGKSTLPSTTNKDTSHADQMEDRSSTSMCSAICGGDINKSCSKVMLVDVTSPSKSSKKLRCYAILDEQSSTSFVDAKVAEYFEADYPTCNYKIKTLSGLETETSGMKIRGLKVQGVGQKKIISIPSILTNAFIPNCSGEVATPSIVAEHSHISHLANHFQPLDASAETLLLIGRDCGAALATKCYGYKAPYAHQTPLGWALVGSVCKSKTNSISQGSVLKVQVNNSCYEHITLNPVFPRKIYEPQEVNIFHEFPDDELAGLSKDDDLFLQKVIPNIQVNSEGNISMPLPFKNNNVRFPNNKMPVYHRSVNTLNKLKNDPKKLDECIESMQKNIDAGHVMRIPDTELPSKNTWHLPVFAVTHPKKDKVRLVFDSAASYRGTSLNSELLQGPDINTQLATVLHRFRLKSFAFTADVESMFYAFHMDPSDHDFTRFFWWESNDPNLPLVAYRATRHIFGNRSSPSVANIGLRYAITNSPDTTDRAKSFVFNNFYVDDGCGSAGSANEAIAILKETITSLSYFNIHLHKITSSSPDVLSAFAPSELDKSVRSKDFNSSGSQRTLGVEWNHSSDCFVIKTDVPHKPFTKRGTLATTNSLFDPLGFVSPVSLAGRLLQRFFIPPKNGSPEIVHLDWDDPLPEQHQHLWDAWTNSLREADSKVEVPRCYLPQNFGIPHSQTLHIFADASVEGTGCVVYMRSINAEGQVHVAFVFGNSKICPRGTSSIPRLELCAALDASIIACKIAQDLNLDLHSCHFYSDSRVVLGYLNNTEKRFSRYVSRRVSIILKSSDVSRWHYIPTDQNPGDIASRPQTFESLTESCWFRGPPFLWCEPLSFFDSPAVQETLPEVVEEHSMKTSLEEISWLSDTFKRSNSWLKLISTVEFVMKFTFNLSNKRFSCNNNDSGMRQPPTHTSAYNLIIKEVQRECFSFLLSPSRSPSPKKVAALAPFVDPEGIIRVGGRLRNSGLSTEVIHPIFLPDKHPVTRLIIDHFHTKTRHQGRVVSMSAVRSAGFFVYHGTAMMKKFIHNCTTCRKLRSACQEQKMGDLPHDRLESDPPFTYCGMDVFGPFHITEGTSTRRNTSTKKTWAIVFICLVTKAIHVEPLPRMDTSTFKNALRRFFSIRGVCRKLRCDRGSNFVGAKNQDTEEIDFKSLKMEANTQECEWQFNPPHSSHFGGIWERTIRSIRKVIDAALLTLGNRSPSRDELHTFLAEASSIVNNTPLYEICNDPNEELPLTPAHLITLKGKPNPPPVEDFKEQDLLAYGSRRWRRVQAISDVFWERWRSEYVQHLQARQKWSKERTNVQKNDIVLMKTKHARRNKWPMARVDSVNTSSDGLVRSVSVILPASGKQSVKTYDRPISEIVPIVRYSEVSHFE